MLVVLSQNARFLREQTAHRVRNKYERRLAYTKLLPFVCFAKSKLEKQLFCEIGDASYTLRFARPEARIVAKCENSCALQFCL